MAQDKNVPETWEELDMPFPDRDVDSAGTRCYGMPMSEMWEGMSERLKAVVREDCERQMPGVPLEEALKNMLFPIWIDHNTEERS